MKTTNLLRLMPLTAVLLCAGVLAGCNKSTEENAAVPPASSTAGMASETPPPAEAMPPAAATAMPPASMTAMPPSGTTAMPPASTTTAPSGMASNAGADTSATIGTM